LNAASQANLGLTSAVLVLMPRRGNFLRPISAA
jgi:hypothetical protein